MMIRAQAEDFTSQGIIGFGELADIANHVAAILLYYVPEQPLRNIMFLLKISEDVF